MTAEGNDSMDVSFSASLFIMRALALNSLSTNIYSHYPIAMHMLSIFLFTFPYPITLVSFSARPNPSHPTMIGISLPFGQSLPGL